MRLYVGLAVYKVGIYPDPYAGKSGGDWADDANVLYDQLRMCRQKGWDGVILYSYTYLDPNSYRQLETVSFNGSSVKQTYDKTLATVALRKLLEELKMLFSSIPFLYYFLPAVVLVYFLVPRSLKNTVLLLFSHRTPG